MLQPGDTIPDVELWTAPGEAVGLHELAARGPCFLFFYLLDWTST